MMKPPDSRSPDRRLRGYRIVLTALLGAALVPMAAAQPDEAPAAGAETRADAATAFEAELERRGALIGSVNIMVENVFNLDDPAEDKSLYRFANSIHVTTRESVVESLLLFESGDRFVARVVDESARLLRHSGYVADASVRPTSYDETTNTVDIDVFVRDAWSLKPSIKFGRSGGANEYGFGLTEKNLTGRGKRLDINFSRDVERDD